MNTYVLRSPCGFKETINRITDSSKNFTERLRNLMARPSVAPAAIRGSVSLTVYMRSFSSSTIKVQQYNIMSQTLFPARWQHFCTDNIFNLIFPGDNVLSI